MLNLLYIPKYKGEKQLFKIAKVVNLVFGEICNCKSNEQSVDPFGVILSPGYMSKTQGTISEYLDKFFKVVKKFNNLQQMYVGIFIGMNGCLKVKNQSITILENHTQAIKSRKINSLNFNFKLNFKDHRKMIFFFKFKSNPDIFLPSTIAKSDIDDFLNNISVEYMLIGSSNQSKNTYYSPTAAHGESDVLFFDNSSFIEKIKSSSLLVRENYLDGCILAQVTSNLDSSNYLNSILKDFLNNNLQ